MGLHPDHCHTHHLGDPDPAHEMPLFTATKSAREDLIIQLFQKDPSICLQVDAEGRTILHWATEYGYGKLVQLMLNPYHYKDLTDSATISSILNKADSKGLTPLLIACNTKREELASFFLTLDADVSAIDQSGNTPLHRAVRANLESLSVLICQKGANVNAKNELKWTPVHEAARTGNATVLRALIKYGGDVNAVTYNNMTPFLTAFFYYKIASKGNCYTDLDGVWKLLIESGCALSQSDGHWTPLTASLSCDNSFIATLLLFNGCRLDRKGRWGRGLLLDAFACSEPMLVKLLSLLGYIPTPEEVHYCSKQLPMYSKVLSRLPGLGSGLHKERQLVVTWLKERGKQPPSLEELCRTSIRQAMNIASGDKSIIENFAFLPIPNRLKQFLGLSDFTHYICNEF